MSVDVLVNERNVVRIGYVPYPLMESLSPVGLILIHVQERFAVPLDALTVAENVGSMAKTDPSV
jgi:hypothetical protein